MQPAVSQFHLAVSVQVHAFLRSLDEMSRALEFSSTALISRRMNLSPFTKGSRVLRALNVIYIIFARIIR